MGIAHLNELLEEVCPDVFKKKQFRDFSGKRIAIDTSWLIVREMAVVHKRVVYETDLKTSEPNRQVIIKSWLGSCLDFILTLLNQGITPVFVFDGKAPKEKEITRQDRMKQRQAKIDLVLKTRQEYLVDPSNEALYKKYQDAYARCDTISLEEREMFKHFIHALGIPSIQASCEAEKLCSILCIEGYVSAVLSTDTDNLVYGCPMLIPKVLEPTYLNGQKQTWIRVVSIQDVLNGLKMTFQTFLDLCIMAGCDYNTNIPYIGIKKSFDLMKQYHSIDNIPTINGMIDVQTCNKVLTKKIPIKEYPIDILNHKVCRQLFEYHSSKDLIDQEFPHSDLDVSLDRLTNHGKTKLQNQTLDGYLDKFLKIYPFVPKTFRSNTVLPFHVEISEVLDDKDEHIIEKDETVIETV
jgi:5'-3' exonuclease